jgi:hypothetical protein
MPSACFMAGFLLDYSLQEPEAEMLRALIFILRGGEVFIQK